MTSIVDDAPDQVPARVSKQLPWHLRGNYAPVQAEVTAFDLAVEGSIPPELAGRYLRNGANPKHGPTPHWFAGDGMIHGIRLRGGRAEWYRNRWVQTKALDRVQRLDAATGTFDLTVGLANTHVIGHAGRILALEEASFPNELSAELDTLGPHDFGGALRTPMTAHPHVCAETGELHFFGYELMRPPYVTYHVADAAGRLVHSQPIDVPGPTMVHDFALSRNFAIFLDLPVTFDIELAMRGTMPFQWDDAYGARIGLLHRERARLGEQPTWFDIEPCYVFHVMNAWDDGGSTVWLDAGRHASMWRGGPDAFEPSILWRYRLDLVTGAVHEEQIDDESHSFPRIDDRRSGLTNRIGWAVAPRPGAGSGMHDPSVIVKFDLERSTKQVHDFGPTCSTGEPVFVPADGAASEDEGWIMTFVHDAASDSSAFVVLDASDVAAAPVATVALPQRVPNGFHGSWIADEPGC